MRKIIALLVSAVIALPALAHEGGHRAYGVVKEVTAARLVVTDEQGKDTAFALTQGTKFLRDGKAIGREQIGVGERAVVKGRDVNGQMEASTVDLGAPPKPVH